MPIPMLASKILQLVIAVVAANALGTVVPLSFNVFNGVADCPAMLGLPICYLVSVGYSLIFVAAIVRNSRIFLLGWIPVILLAAIGSLMELNGIVTCPRSGNAIPMCYFSALLAVLIGLAYLAIHKINSIK